MTFVRTARSLTARGLRRLNPPPAEAAWRRILRQAERTPPRTAGRLRLLDLDIAFPDAVSLAPQWHGRPAP